MVKFEFYSATYGADGSIVAGVKLADSVNGLDFGKIQTGEKSGNAELLNLVKIRVTPDPGKTVEYVQLFQKYSNGVSPTQMIPVGMIGPSVNHRYTGAIGSDWWAQDSEWVPFYPSSTSPEIDSMAQRAIPAWVSSLLTPASHMGVSASSLWFFKEPFATSKNIGALTQEGSDWVSDYIWLDVRNNDHPTGIASGIIFSTVVRQVLL